MSETKDAVRELKHFEKFRDRLIKTKRDYRKSGDPGSRRLAWIESLCVMSDFVRDRLEPTDEEGIAALQMLDELVAGLEDLNKGRSPPMLIPTATRPHRQIDLATEGDYVTAAVAVDFYVDAGVSLKEAAQKVVSAARKTGASLPPGSHSQRSDVNCLIDYRKRIRGRGTSAPAKYRDAKEMQEMLHQWRDEKIAEKDMTKKEFADYLLKEIWPALKGKVR